MRTRLLGIAIALAATACLPTTERDLQIAQAINEMSESFNEIRQQQALIQDELDSLRMTALRQDSIIRQLANLAGVQIPPR